MPKSCSISAKFSALSCLHRRTSSRRRFPASFCRGVQGQHFSTNASTCRYGIVNAQASCRSRPRRTHTPPLHSPLLQMHCVCNPPYLFSAASTSPTVKLHFREAVGQLQTSLGPSGLKQPKSLGVFLGPLARIDIRGGDATRQKSVKRRV